MPPTTANQGTYLTICPPCLQAAQLKSFKPASGKQFVALLVPPRPPEQG